MIYNIYIQIIYILLSNIPAHCYERVNNGQTSVRTNTLSDDADDIQPQLDNEARDRLKFNRLPTVWVFHRPLNYSKGHPLILPRSTMLLEDLRITTMEMRKYPTTTRWKPSHLTVRNSNTKLWDYSGFITRNFKMKTWQYSNQDEWHKKYPKCGGHSQSPVDLPTRGHVNVKGCKCLNFYNYDVIPISLYLYNDGRRYILTGTWNVNEKPLIHGGAAFGRRYVFHSIIFHWPSEHKIGGMIYPFETQVLHISAEYNSIEEAITASPHDPMSILGVANIYMFKNHTQRGLLDILKNVPKIHTLNISMPLNPLSHFSPPMKEYVCYQGSLTTPPCTESVLWFVRARTLPISRVAYNFANSLLDEEDIKNGQGRYPHPLNDRKLYFVDRGN